MKITKKIKKVLPIGLLIVLVAGVTIKSLYILIFEGLNKVMIGYNLIEYNSLIFISGLIILLLLGHNFIKKYSK